MHYVIKIIGSKQWAEGDAIPPMSRYLTGR